MSENQAARMIYLSERVAALADQVATLTRERDEARERASEHLRDAAIYLRQRDDARHAWGRALDQVAEARSAAIEEAARVAFRTGWEMSGESEHETEARGIMCATYRIEAAIRSLLSREEG